MSRCENGSEQTGVDFDLQQFLDHVFTHEGTATEPMGCNTAHYLSMLDNVEMSDEDKTELVHSLWHVLDGIVRLQFGIHPLTDIMNENAASRATDSVSVVKSSPIETNNKDERETR